MKILYIISLLVVNTFLVNGQNDIQNLTEITLDYKSIDNIQLSNEVSLKDLYKIDDIEKLLEKLGDPISTEYEDHIAYESWYYVYRDFNFTVTNKDGYKTVESLSIIPTNRSTIKFLNQKLEKSKSISELIDEGQIGENNLSGDHAFKITSLNPVTGEKFNDRKVTLSTSDGRITLLRIVFID